MHFDPVTRFWVGIVVTVAIAISQGTIVLTDAVPENLIPHLVAWSGILAFVGSALLTALNAAASTNTSRLASAAAIPEVSSIVTTSRKMADDNGPKVVADIGFLKGGGSRLT